MKISDLNIHYDPTNLHSDETKQMYANDLAKLKIDGSYIRSMLYLGIKPSHEQLLASVNHDGYNIKLINLHLFPPRDVIYAALTNERFILYHNKRAYDFVVKRLFPRSSLLVDRWVGYGDHVRQRKPRGTKS